jgi:hypothetical protein
MTLGRLVPGAQWRDESGDWTYGVRGTDVEGDEAEIRFGISDDRNIITLVTVIDPN